jgi:hypothetical protein
VSPVFQAFSDGSGSSFLFQFLGPTIPMFNTSHIPYETLPYIQHEECGLITSCTGYKEALATIIETRKRIQALKAPTPHFRLVQSVSAHDMLQPPAG